jgi:hypothetical protein
MTPASVATDESVFGAIQPLPFAALQVFEFNEVTAD